MPVHECREALPHHCMWSGTPPPPVRSHLEKIQRIIWLSIIGAKRSTHLRATGCCWIPFIGYFHQGESWERKAHRLRHVGCWVGSATALKTGGARDNLLDGIRHATTRVQIGQGVRSVHSWKDAWLQHRMPREVAMSALQMAHTPNVTHC